MKDEMAYYLSEEEIDERLEHSYNESYGSYIESFYSIEKPEEDEFNEALLFELCKKQDETNNLLTSIKKMLTFFTVMMILSMIFGFIGFCSVCSQL